MEAKLKKQFDLLQESLSKLFDELEGFTHPQMNHQASPEKWSANQTIYHLFDAEKKSLAYLRKKIENLDQSTLRKAGVSEMCKSIALNAFLKSPIKVKAPASVSQVPDEANYEQLKADWVQVREDMEKFCKELPVKLLPYPIYKHPRAGRLTIYQAVNFFQAHFDRHRKQILEALQVAIQ